MLTRLRCIVRNDDGITLMELVVAMTITTLVMTLAMVFFVNVENSGARTVVSNQVTADARTTLDSWTSMLRVADFFDSAQTDRFEEITPTEVVFWADLDNRTTADVNPVVPQKIALLLNTTNDVTGEGQLIEIRFVPGDPSTVQTVRRMAFDAEPTGGPGNPVFQPYLSTGGDPLFEPTPTKGCLDNGTAVLGLCLQSLPDGAGMPDPQVAADSLAVSAGTLTGNPAVDVDSTLQQIGGITIAFTVTDPAHRATEDFASSASVNSGWPSS